MGKANLYPTCCRGTPVLPLLLRLAAVLAEHSHVDMHRCVPGAYNNGCHSVSYLPTQKVIFCTMAKSSSSEWRRFLFRVHNDSGATACHGKPCWCGNPGCLHEGPGAPPIVRDARHFELLRRQGYVSAMFMRDPYERVGSMYTGTFHLFKGGNGLDGKMDLDHFVNSWLPNSSHRANEHFMGQMAQCNFGLSSAHPAAPRWDVVATSGANGTDTFERVSAFIRRVFGAAVYERAARRGWCLCESWWNSGQPSEAVTPSCNVPFFAPHESKGEENAARLTAQQRARIEELYSDDVAVFEYVRRTRGRDGAAPDDATGACRQFDESAGAATTDNAAATGATSHAR